MGNIYPKVRKGPKNRLDDTEIKEGQMLTTTDTKEIFVDIDQTRVQLMTSGSFTEVNNVGKLLGWDGEKLVLLDSSEFVKKSELGIRCITDSNGLFIGSSDKSCMISIIDAKNSGISQESGLPNMPGEYMNPSSTFLVLVRSTTMTSTSEDQFKLYCVLSANTSNKIWKVLTLASSTSATDGSYRFSLNLPDSISKSPYIKVNKGGMVSIKTWML